MNAGNVNDSWAGGLHPCSFGLCNMHINRGCLPELGAGTQTYSSFSEWEYILCNYMLEITNLFLDFTRYESKDCLECQKGHWTFVLFRLL